MSTEKWSASVTQRRADMLNAQRCFRNAERFKEARGSVSDGWMDEALRGLRYLAAGLSERADLDAEAWANDPSPIGWDWPPVRS